MRKTIKKTSRRKPARTKKKVEPKSKEELNLLLREIVAEKRRIGLLSKGSQVGKLRTYDMNKSFKYGEKVEHPAFGTGVVQLIKARTVEVAFADKNRVLAHSHSGVAA